MKFVIVTYDIDETKNIFTYFIQLNPNAELIHCSDDVEALEFITETENSELPDLIIIDLGDSRNGLELVRKIKANPLTKQIPIVVLSDSHVEDDIIDSYMLAVKAYMLKPVDEIKAKKMLSIHRNFKRKAFGFNFFNHQIK